MEKLYSNLALSANNPLGIHANFSQGGRGCWQYGTKFCHYKNLQSGFAAGFSILFGLMEKRYRNNTVSTILRAFLGDSVTDLEKYLSVVCEHAQVDRTEIVRKQDKNKLSRIVWALANYECETNFSLGLIENAYAMAIYNDRST